MATTSFKVLGSGGSFWDPFSSAGEGYYNYLLSDYSAQRTSAIQGEAAEDYALWSARHLYPSQLQSQLDNYGLEQELALRRAHDSVSNMRSALINAGYNPLLALDGAGAGVGGSGVLAMPNSAFSTSAAVRPSPSNSSAGMEFDPAEASARKSEASILRSRSVSAASQAAVDRATSALEVLKIAAEMSALENPHKVGPVSDEIEVLDHQGWRQLRDNILNRLNKEGYQNNTAHAVFEDAVKVIDTASKFKHGEGVRIERRK